MGVHTLHVPLVSLERGAIGNVSTNNLMVVPVSEFKHFTSARYSLELNGSKVFDSCRG